MTHTFPAALSWKSFTVALAILLAIFMFANPIWEEHDMNAWNQNIWWSYLPIPLIVWMLLLLERKFSWPALGLEVMKLTFVKFVITITMANAIWEFKGAPGTGLPEMVAATDSQLPAFEVRPIPEDFTTWDGSEMSSLSGVLLDAEGAPLANRLIFVSEGLEGSRFAPPIEAAEFVNEGAGFNPRQRVIQTHQVVSLESTAGELHTAVFDSADGQRRVLNVAVIPGEERKLMFDSALGHMRLSCSVHGELEESANVLLLHHPFWTWTAEDGSFELNGVPPGNLRFSTERAGTTVELTYMAFPRTNSQHMEWRIPIE